MVEKERLKKLMKKYDFLSMGDSTYREREMPKEPITDFKNYEAGIHYNKEDDDFYKQKLLGLREDSIKKPGIMLSTNDKLKIPELDKNYGSNFNSISKELEECRKTGRTNNECIEIIKRKERTGKVGWDSLDYRIPDDSVKNEKLKKQKNDLIERKISENRIKNLEDFGKAVRELKQQITGKRFIDFIEQEDFDSEEEFYRLIEEY